MKIKKLIEILSKYDGFKEVYFEQDNGAESKVDEVTIVSDDGLSINSYIVLK